jgi:NADPH:quinone reductase-like Zn-dependent oxidoreductase
MNVVKRGGRLVSLLEQPPQQEAQKHHIRALKNAATPTDETLRTIIQLIEAGQVKAVVGRTFSLAEARQAHELSQNGHGRGRIVLHIS